MQKKLLRGNIQRDKNNVPSSLSNLLKNFLYLWSQPYRVPTSLILFNSVLKLLLWLYANFYTVPRLPVTVPTLLCTVPSFLSTVPRLFGSVPVLLVSVPRPLSQEYCPKTSVPRLLSQECPKSIVLRVVSQDYCSKTTVPRLLS